MSVTVYCLCLGSDFYCGAYNTIIMVTHLFWYKIPLGTGSSYPIYDKNSVRLIDA